MANKIANQIADQTADETVRMKLNRQGWALWSVVLVAGCAAPAEETGPPGGPTPEVGVVRPAAQDVVLRTELPGRVVALRVSEVRPQVGGVVRRRLFEEGARVQAGQLLYELDDAAYRAAYGVAEGNLARAEAKAASLTRSLQRHAELVRIDGVSRQEYEDMESAQAQARAEVRAARAALDAARVDLERTRIRAAISGRIGRSSVSEGALVTRDQQAALSSIVQLDEVYVDIVQPSQELVRLQQQRQAGGLQAAGARVQLRMEGGMPYAHAGSLRFNEVSVDPASGAVTLRARFPNPEGLLMPGMYVRASVEQGVAVGALLVPHQGLEHDAQGAARVWVVNAQDQVEARPVQADTLLEGQWVVRSGLQAGERVIVEGRRRVEPGQQVKPVPLTSPPAAQGAGEGPAPRKGA